MVSELENRLKGNILEPLLFTEGEIDLFVRDNKCGLCGSHLFAKHAPNRKYTAHCPNCGPVMEHTHVNKYKVNKVKQNVRIAKAELCQREKTRSAEVILKELGF